MEVDIELKPKQTVFRHELRPFGLRVRRAEVLFAEHGERFQTQAFADVRLGRETVGGFEFARETRSGGSSCRAFA